MSKKTSTAVKWTLSVCSVILTTALIVSLELTRQGHVSSVTRIDMRTTMHHRTGSMENPNRLHRHNPQDRPTGDDGRGHQVLMI